MQLNHWGLLALGNGSLSSTAALELLHMLYSFIFDSHKMTGVSPGGQIKPRAEASFTM
jgi:hypothetical protein